MSHLSYRHPRTSSHLHSPRSLLEKVYRKLSAQDDRINDVLNQSMGLDIFWEVVELSCLTSRLSDSRFVIDLDSGDIAES